MIVCSECGRAVSNKAEACVGCGAPIGTDETNDDIDLVSQSVPTKPLSVARLKRHLMLASTTLLLGLIAALVADHLQSASRIDSFAAALLLIAGISWTLVLLVRLWSARK